MINSKPCNSLFVVFSFVALVIITLADDLWAFENWRLNEIAVGENGFFHKTDGDPFIVFPEVSQSTCGPMGVQLAISFDPVPIKPVLLEIFWSTDYLGFGEENKVFFIIHPNKDGSPNKVVVPLDHTAGFTQIRLDFPSYISTAFKVEDYAIVSLNDLHEGYEQIEAYYNLSIEESLKPEIVVPYFLKSLAHGPKRMMSDPFFLFFWLSLIFSILFAIRYTAKSLRTEKQ